MKIFHLFRIDVIGYDEYDAFVIVAKDEATAREMANQNTGDEGKIWTDELLVICEVVDKKHSGIVLASFNAA